MPSFYSRLTSSASSSRPDTARYQSAFSQDEELEAAFSEPGVADADSSSYAHPPLDGDDHHPAESSRLIAGTSDPDGRLGGGEAPLPGAYDFEANPFDTRSSAPAPVPDETRPVSLAERARTFRERFLPNSIYNRLSTQDDHPDGLALPDGGASHVLPDAHLPLPSRGPPPPPRSSTPSQTAHAGGRSVGGGNQNDGVFANLSAKPDGFVRRGADGEMEYVGGDDDNGRGKDEVLPSYDSAALDAAPPYWETTVTLPGGTYGVLGPDDVLVEGLPVGNLFGFAWNLLVSMSFQFVGFLLTYLLHTTHAAKNGSRAGLGITLIQYGLYLRTRAAELSNMTPEDLVTGHNGTTTVISAGDVLAADDAPSRDGNDGTPWGLFGATGRHDWDGSSSVTNGTLKGGIVGGGQMYDGVMTAEQLHMSSVANEWLSYVLMVVGWGLVILSCLNYWRAVRWARAVRSEAASGGTAA